MVDGNSVSSVAEEKSSADEEKSAAVEEISSLSWRPGMMTGLDMTGLKSGESSSYDSDHHPWFLLRHEAAPQNI